MQSDQCLKQAEMRHSILQAKQSIKQCSILVRVKILIYEDRWQQKSLSCRKTKNISDDMHHTHRYTRTHLDNTEDYSLLLVYEVQYTHAHHSLVQDCHMIWTVPELHPHTVWCSYPSRSTHSKHHQLQILHTHHCTFPHSLDKFVEITSSKHRVT